MRQHKKSSFLFLFEKQSSQISHTHKWAPYLCFISDCFEHLSRSQNPSLTITHAITNSFGLPFNLSFPIFAQVFILSKKRCGALKLLRISVNLLPLSDSTITLFECFLRSLWRDIKFGNAETAKRKRKLFKAKYKSNPNESLKRNRAKCSPTRWNLMICAFRQIVTFYENAELVSVVFQYIWTSAHAMRSL